MKAMKIWLMILVSVSAAGISHAERGPSYEERMEKLEATLAALQAELADLKAQQAKATQAAAVPERTEPMVGKAKEADSKSVPGWVANVTVKGDFRYRHEWKDDESKIDDRNRHRIRARVGVYSKINDEMDVGFRLASGNNAAPMGDSEGSSTSTNQDLTNAFSSKNIWLDLAYVAYHPTGIEGLNVRGGKITNPYYHPGNSNLMFDTDVNPEGFAATHNTNWGEDLAVFGAVGGYYVEERSIDADTSLWGMQAGVTYSLPDAEKVYATVGGGYYDYGNTQGKPALGSSLINFYGNNSTGGVYDSDFDIVQAFGELGIPVSGLPFKVFGDYVKNISANSSEDTGFLLGASLGKCKKARSWQVAYNYRELDADAVVGALTEGTFAGGGSNIKGHTLAFGYQLAKNVQLATSYFVAERTRSSTTDHDMVLVDLKAKF